MLDRVGPVGSSVERGLPDVRGPGLGLPGSLASAGRGSLASAGRGRLVAAGNSVKALRMPPVMAGLILLDKSVTVGPLRKAG
ncbi:hypothetical protein SAMN05421541_102516 [Actinoplanes philippinensis]|uniref:Uncharacterized protein n=1 Tax=Actinoplanes philippinensis TaxID=35752 RepID=A0A1I2BT30_9ACTN|nr:hypothetical protein SAMN05421541_102516 [Actinoplanes philippinensis]